MSDKKYIKLEDLDVYNISRELSRMAWDLYSESKMEEKIIIIQQFLRSIDSIGANIAEGYGRYHFLDKVKFYYNARASMFEAKHWLYLLKERELIVSEKYDLFIEKLESLSLKLNAYIKSNKDKKLNH